VLRCRTLTCQLATAWTRAAATMGRPMTAGVAAVAVAVAATAASPTTGDCASHLCVLDVKGCQPVLVGGRMSPLLLADVQLCVWDRLLCLCRTASCTAFPVHAFQSYGCTAYWDPVTFSLLQGSAWQPYKWHGSFVTSGFV